MHAVGFRRCRGWREQPALYFQLFPSHALIWMSDNFIAFLSLDLKTSVDTETTPVMRYCCSHGRNRYAYLTL
jgi:hypothetical protein